jgi:hypothetical protein
VGELVIVGCFGEYYVGDRRLLLFSSGVWMVAGARSKTSRALISSNMRQII